MLPFLKKFFFALLLVPQLAVAQEDTLTAAKGSFYLFNWQEEEGSPLINKMNLNYEYKLINGELAQRLSFQYFSEDTSVKIEQIIFKVNVYKSGEYITDMTIAYPAAIAKSGGESGWYMVKGADAGDLFNNFTQEEALQLIRSGFDLKEPEVMAISFQKEEKQKRLKNEDAPKSSLFSYKKNSSRTAGKIPWRLSIAPGIGYLQYPINLTTISRTETLNSSSTLITTASETGGGYSLSLQGSFWPFYTQNFGVAGNFTGLATLLPLSDRFYQWTAGTKGYIGRSRLKFALEARFEYNYSKHKEEFSRIFPEEAITTITFGQEIYTTQSIEAGVMWWTTKVLTKRTISARAIFEHVSLYHSNHWIAGGALATNMPNGLGAEVRVFPKYPRLFMAPGNEDKGVWFSIIFTRGFDWFEKSYFGSAKGLR